MSTVGAYEAKTHFSKLLERVEKGETITITKHGNVVAQLVPAPQVTRMSKGEVLDALRELRKGVDLRGLSIRELIEEGRRY